MNNYKIKFKFDEEKNAIVESESKESAEKIIVDWYIDLKKYSYYRNCELVIHSVEKFRANDKDVRQIIRDRFYVNENGAFFKGVSNFSGGKDAYIVSLFRTWKELDEVESEEELNIIKKYIKIHKDPDIAVESITCKIEKESHKEDYEKIKEWLENGD